MKTILINIGSIIFAFLTHYLLMIAIGNSSTGFVLNLKLILDVPGIQFGTPLESWSIILKNTFILFVLFRVSALFLARIILKKRL